MKRLLLGLSLLPLTCFSQTLGEANGGEVLFNPDNLACISEEAKAKINAEVEVNVAKLIKQGKLSIKNGSLTSKDVGDTVVAGEYLGVIGSSGNSTGPHLYFEVYDSNSNLVNPFSGICNNITTWWQDQPDYNDPNVNAVLTHSTPPEFNTCPETQTTNLQNKFLPNSDIYMAGYTKDQLTNTTVYVRLYKPNGSNIQWSQAMTNNYSTSYWSVNNLSDLGTYKLRITYEGQSVDHEFEVALTLGIKDEQLAKISVAPNPFEDELKISGFTFDQADYNMAIFNQLGQKVIEKEVFTDRLGLQFLSKGMCFLNIGDKTTGSSKSFKIVKK